MDIKSLLGSNLKRFRQAADLTQTQLADIVGLTLQTVFSYESGVKWPRPDNLVDIAVALKIQPWELLADGTAPTRKPTIDEAIELLANERGFNLVPRG